VIFLQGEKSALASSLVCLENAVCTLGGFYSSVFTVTNGEYIILK
jgi:hypothetical protein